MASSREHERAAFATLSSCSPLVGSRGRRGVPRGPRSFGSHRRRRDRRRGRLSERAHVDRRVRRAGPECRRAFAAVGLPAGEADEYYGFSLIRGRDAAEPVRLRRDAARSDGTARAANELQVAWSVDVLLHESAHLGRFTYDEALAEACARSGLPAELHRLYGLAYHSPELTRLTLAATWFRRTQAAAYQGGTCRSA